MSNTLLLTTGVLALALACMHLLASRLRILAVAPRSRWLSFAGGVSVAYVFLHILPELSAHQATFAKGLGLGDKAAEAWVYGITLAGLVAFYGLERLAKTFRARGTVPGERHAAFWLHIGSFAIYNVLVGYLLLHREEAGLTSLLLYFLAMALHFLINDFGLREHHKGRYDRVGRWLLMAAPLVGWVLGVTITVSATAIGFFFAFLAGGVLLNVIRRSCVKNGRAASAPSWSASWHLPCCWFSPGNASASQAVINISAHFGIWTRAARV